MVEADEARRRFGSAHRVVLATNRADGTVDLVPITFSVAGDVVYSVLDHKPKTTFRLRRLANIERDANVSLLADHFDDDWAELWWVRAKGTATVVRDGPERDRIATVIGARYQQYEGNTPAGPAIAISVAEWKGWSAG